MDFAQRSTPATGTPTPSRGPAPHKHSRTWVRVMRWSTSLMLVSLTILVVSLIGIIGFSKTHEQAKYVDTGKYQAVFLNGGQVYFGKITSLNNKYLAMSNIYYLRVNQTVQPNTSTTAANNDVSLVKLGCELHGPQDQMVINNDQVIFWENLKADGQVAKAVAEFQKQNPNGQDCTAAAASTSTTPATSTTTTKKP